MARLSTHTRQVQCERRVVRVYPMIPHKEKLNFFLKVKYLKKFSQNRISAMELLWKGQNTCTFWK